MPLRFRIDLDADLVLTTAEGIVSGEDLTDHARKLADTPNRPLRELVDFSDRDEVTVPTETVRQMASLLSERDQNTPGSRVALVAKTDAIFGMMRLFEAHREHPHVTLRVFRDREEALRWLFRSD
ncbi:MAG: hypothetical protein QNK03_23525 [Myxococcota bacterium]|nr:hypothetical protein [Myxococcota bacterium]